MKLRYWILLACAAIVVVAGAAVLLETQAGLRWAVATVERYSDGAIEIGTAQGKLAGPLVLEHVRLELSDAVIEVRHLELDWRPSALAAGKLHVTEIRGSGVRIATRPDEKPSQGLPEKLELPLHVIVTDARFKDVALKTRTRELHLNRLAVSLDADDERIRLSKLEARGPRIVLAGDLRVQPHGDWPLDAALAVILRPPGYPVIEGRTRLGGSLRGTLELKQTLHAPFPAELDANVSSLFDTPRMHGTLHIAGLDPHMLDPDWPRLFANADLDFGGSLQRFKTKGTVSIASATTHTIHLDLEAALSDQRLFIEHLNLALDNASARLSLRGSVNTTAPQAADLTLAWKHLVWPLDAKSPLLTAGAGGAHLNGNLDDWTLFATTLLQARDLPPGRWALKAHGDKRTIGLDALAGRWLGGTIAGVGGVQLEGARPFRFTARVRDVQAQAISKDLKGHVGFDLAANGQLEPLQARARLTHLAGTLQGRPIEGKADLAWAADTLSVHTLRLAVGDNHLDARGTWGKKADLDWRLEAPELAALGAGLGGRLEAHGTVTGSSAAPRIELDLAGERLRWRDLGITQARLQADILPASRTASALTLHLEGLERGGLDINRLDATLEGPADAQHFSIALAGDEGNLKLAGVGRLEQEIWRGKLTAGKLSAAAGSHFVLERPALLAFGTAMLKVGKNCWRGSQNGTFCLAAASGPEGWKADLDLRDLPLALANPWLGKGLALAGRLNGALAAAGGGGKLKVQAALHAGHGSVTRALAGTPQRLAFDEAGLEARLDRDKVTARLGLILADGGMLDAAADIPWRSHEEPAGTLHLVAHLPDLSGLGALNDAVSDVAGRLDADLTVNGSLKAPRFHGDARFSRLALTLARYGTRIEKGEIALHGTGNGLRIDGRVADGRNGRLAVRGTLGRKASQWTLQAQVQGKDFRAVDMPEMQVAVSPDFKLRIEDRLIALDGSIAIPSAHITPPHFSNAIAPSLDLLIVGEEQGQNAPSRRLEARLHIRLGDDVHFDGYGLTARVGGEITLNERPGELTTASGELKILDGHYKAYGQNLTIAHGRLLFSGGPIANPGLDIRAVREIGLVSVGLQVNGSLRNPHLRVFSDPPMSQSNALAYLLFGHGVQQNSNAENSTLNRAANAIGLAGGTYLVKTLGKHVGVDTVSVESASPYNTDSNQASLFLGKYLSPRLYVSYGIGLYAPINLLRVRYTLSRHWALEAESGTISGADILFNIEF